MPYLLIDKHQTIFILLLDALIKTSHSGMNILAPVLLFKQSLTLKQAPGRLRENLSLSGKRMC